MRRRVRLRAKGSVSIDVADRDGVCRPRCKAARTCQGELPGLWTMRPGGLPRSLGRDRSCRILARREGWMDRERIPKRLSAARERGDVGIPPSSTKHCHRAYAHCGLRTCPGGRCVRGSSTSKDRPAPSVKSVISAMDAQPHLIESHAQNSVGVPVHVPPATVGRVIVSARPSPLLSRGVACRPTRTRIPTPRR
jgi:hypothetical protein